MPPHVESSMSGNKFGLQLVSPDLRHEETIHQICNALHNLESISSHIFSSISLKCQENQAKLKSVNERIELAQKKIDSLKGSNKATKVFSSAKYPAAEEYEVFHSPYQHIKDNGIDTNERVKYHLKSKHKKHVDEKISKDKNKIFTLNENLFNRKKVVFEDDGEGLGKLPSEIVSMSSLLLFNTDENPYKKYNMLDPLGVLSKMRIETQDDEEGIAEAPSTILQREEMQRLAKENVFYVPPPGQVPEIAVPDFLPDLLGVAGDLSYSIDLGPSIAPSFPANVDLPELPSILSNIETLPPVPSSSVSEANNSFNSSSISSGPPPPPPPPPLTDPQSNGSFQTSVNSNPPPPPPPAPPVSLVQNVSTPDDSKKVSSDDTGGGRASLMDAIRKVGGSGKANLKNAKVKKDEKKKEKIREKEESTSTSNNGGDLFSELHANLLRRRKGISGTSKEPSSSKDASSSKDDSLMGRISTMIPPPPIDDGSDNEDDDDDW